MANILPFPHAHIRQKVLTTKSFHLVVAFDLLPVAVIAVPDIQQGHKIRLGILKSGMYPVGLPGFFHGTLARVLDAESCGDNRHFIDAALFSCFNQHAGQPGIQRILAIRRPFSVNLTGF